MKYTKEDNNSSNSDTHICSKYSECLVRVENVLSCITSPWKINVIQHPTGNIDLELLGYTKYIHHTDSERQILDKIVSLVLKTCERSIREQIVLKKFEGEKEINVRLCDLS